MRDEREWFRASLEFEIAAPDELAAERKLFGLAAELVERYGLARDPVVTIEPARETVRI